MRTIMLCDDLIFISRVRGTAQAVGGQLLIARNLESLVQQVREHMPGSIIVDLQFPGLVIVELMQQLQTLEPPPRVIGYGSHVDVETLRAARQAGCAEVMPRSQFVERLETALPGWLGLPASPA